MFYLMLILLILVGSAATVITIQNYATPVHIMMFTWQTPDMPVGILLLCAFLAGALLLYLVAAVGAWRERREVVRLRRRVIDLEQQMAIGPISTPLHAAPMSAEAHGEYDRSQN